MTMVDSRLPLDEAMLCLALAIADARADVRVSVDRHGASRLLTVRDNEIGIDPAQPDRLFKVFQRLRPWGAYEGEGVGLALRRRIVERHGGRIWAESDGPGMGAAFHFPLAAEAPPENDEPTSPSGSGRTASRPASAEGVME